LSSRPKGPDVVSRAHQYVVIAFGKKETGFYTRSGESPADYVPKPGDPNAAAWSRFIALELFLADILQLPKAGAENGITSGRGQVK
jgi:hypothetical protein